MCAIRLVLRAHLLVVTLSCVPATLVKANMQVGASAVRRTATGSNTTAQGPAAAPVAHVAPGSQQQWFARDSTVNNFTGGVWNMVFSGVEGAPASHCGNKGAVPTTTVAQTPTISEKPYITIDPTSGKYSLQVRSSFLPCLPIGWLGAFVVGWGEDRGVEVGGERMGAVACSGSGSFCTARSSFSSGRRWWRRSHNITII